MRAMLLDAIAPLRANPAPLRLAEVPVPQPGPGEVLVQVAACGVCHTEIDEIEGRTPPTRLPAILGHQVVGRVAGHGPRAGALALGERVGVAWIYSACGVCDQCRAGRENLCPQFRATGRDAPGGYAEYLTVPETSTFRLPDGLDDVAAAPLLCAGAIGYRSLRLASLAPGEPLGLTGFGASAHLVLPLARHLLPGSPIFVFARSVEQQQFARELGADWAGDTHAQPPAPLRAIIDTTPVWEPVVAALAALAPGGRLVINAIRKERSDQAALLGLDYGTHLWQEKEIKSVANVTRADVAEFLDLAAELRLAPTVQVYPLEQANQALVEPAGRGARVLRIA